MAVMKPLNYNMLTPTKRATVREQYIAEQDGMCFYCNVGLELDPAETVVNEAIDWGLFPPGFLRYPIHLQHDHETGMTEGAVHAYCNAVMWQYEGR